MKRSKPEQDSPWQKTKVANLIRYVPSGVYFARVRVRGKLIRKSLKTTVFSVAQVRLPDFVKEQRSLNENRASKPGKLTFGEAIKTYQKNLDEDTRLKPGAKLYRRKTIDALVKSWPGLKEREIKSLSEADCSSWAKDFRANYSPSVFNNTVGTLRQILHIGIKEGVRYNNPAHAIKKTRNRSKRT